jgi:outer membrane receptor protein involved in Fe transport
MVRLGQLAAGRQPLHPAGGPGEQPAHLRLGPGIQRRPATGIDADQPAPAAYDLVNLSAGLDFDSGLGVQVYANNLFDENALLSFDRERGGRARLGYNIGRPARDWHHAAAEFGR